ncbi:hypothetical protein BKA70DRAFT_1422437 [Coprinopsis sp. MPI-PUGE-AT-0042]|nr:hypothetical protein BKA70DRAFT_1422437 [Coprinopsis sp. MPI-PUGE-AT-0042]
MDRLPYHRGPSQRVQTPMPPPRQSWLDPALRSQTSGSGRGSESPPRTTSPLLGFEARNFNSSYGDPVEAQIAAADGPTLLRLRNAAYTEAFTKQRMLEAEAEGLKQMVARLYEERTTLGLGGHPLAMAAPLSISASSSGSGSGSGSVSVKSMSLPPAPLPRVFTPANPLPTEEEENYLDYPDIFFEKDEWDKVMEQCKKTSSKIPDASNQRLSFLTDEEGNYPEPDRGTVFRNFYNDLLNEIYAANQARPSWKLLPGTLKRYLVVAIFNEFIEFRLATDLWKAELWAEEKYSSWARTWFKQDDAGKGKRKRTRDDSEGHEEKPRVARKDALVPKEDRKRKKAKTSKDLEPSQKDNVSAAASAMSTSGTSATAAATNSSTATNTSQSASTVTLVQPVSTTMIPAPSASAKTVSVPDMTTTAPVQPTQATMTPVQSTATTMVPMQPMPTMTAPAAALPLSDASDASKTDTVPATSTIPPAAVSSASTSDLGLDASKAAAPDGTSNKNVAGEQSGGKANKGRGRGRNILAGASMPPASASVVIQRDPAKANPKAMKKGDKATKKKKVTGRALCRLDYLEKNPTLQVTPKDFGPLWSNNYSKVEQNKWNDKAKMLNEKSDEDDDDGEEEDQDQGANE